MSTDHKDTKIHDGPRLFTEPSGVTSIQPPTVQYSYTENKIAEIFGKEAIEAFRRCGEELSAIFREFVASMRRYDSPVYRYPAPPEFQPPCRFKHPGHFDVYCELPTRHAGMHYARIDPLTALLTHKNVELYWNRKTTRRIPNLLRELYQMDISEVAKKYPMFLARPSADGKSVDLFLNVEPVKLKKE